MVATGSISCSNTTFGDPIVGTVKHCDYRDEPRLLLPRLWGRACWGGTLPP